MKTRKRNKQGISLIVLVITIIVMIILAAAIILSLSSNGIINRANEAVEKTDKAQVQTLANTIWMEAYLDGARTKSELYNAVIKGLKENNINPDIYSIQISSSGIGKVEDAIWVQDGTVVTNTVTGLEIDVGDYIDYKANVAGYVDTAGWQVLGAENGELLVVSSGIIATPTIGNHTDLNMLQKVWETLVTYLDSECAKYGEGAYATSVRSMTGEDIDKIAKYDGTTFKGEDLGESAVLDYGRELTFLWDSEGNVIYTYDGLETPGILTRPHDKFVWYDEASKSWKESTTKTVGVIKAADGTIAKVTNNAVMYEGTSKITDEKAYTLIFGTDTTPLDYGLASPVNMVLEDCLSYAARYICNGYSLFGDLVISDGYCIGDAIQLRVVVSLSSDIRLQLVNDETGDGETSIEDIEVNSWKIINNEQ